MEMAAYEIPNVYITYSSITLIIGTPINLFTLWMIIKVLPESASTYRWHLTWYQFLATLMELHLHLGLPEIFLPTLAATTYGFLYKMGMSMRHILLIGAILVISMLLSTAQCIYYRHWLILDEHSKLKISGRTFGIIAAFHYLFFNGILAFSILMIPVECGPQSPNLANIIKKYPTYAFLTSLTDICSTYLAPTYPPYITIDSLKILLIEIIIFTSYSLPTCTLVVGHSFSLLNGRSTYMSEKTRQMHKQYLIVLLQGVVMPMFLIAVPLLFFSYVMVTETFVPQALLDFLWSLMFAHTFICSLNILFTSKHYRRYLMDLASRIFKIKKVPPKPSIFLSINRVNTKFERNFISVK